MLNVTAATLNKFNSQVVRPILAINVALEDGSQVSTYALLDSGTNKSAVLKSFVARNQIDTNEKFMKLNTLNSEMWRREKFVKLLSSLL